MSEVDFSAIDRRSEPIVSNASAHSVERMLVIKPESFFSLRFHMHVEEQETEERPVYSPPVRSGVKRIIDRDLLLMILLIGVPILAYCVLFLPK